jgi:hypothetical protein
MKNFIFLIITVLFSINIFAQTGTDANNQPDIFKEVSKSTKDEGKIVIYQDEQVKQLVNRYIDAHRKDTRIPGYKIRIFSDSGQPARQKAYSERDRFATTFPNMPPPTVEYETPNFKVYVGGFRTKTEAFRAYKQIAKEFRNAFMVPARINLPKL